MQPRVAEAQLQRDVPREGHHVPGFEPRDQPRLDLRVLCQVVIQAGGKRRAEVPIVRDRAWENPRANWRTISNAAIELVGIQALGAVHFAIAAQRHDVRVFDLPEIVLGLRVGEAEDRAGVGGGVDMRHAIAVAIDDYRGGQLRGSMKSVDSGGASGALFPARSAARVSAGALSLAVAAERLVVGLMG